MAKKQKVKVVKVTVERRIPVFKKTCPVCGKTFEGTKLSKYCSKRCLNRADYHRHAEERRKKRLLRYHKEEKKAGGK
jgi:endogenous inhibitor of DNA gyrase (YacG/DUF329 family)